MIKKVIFFRATGLLVQQIVKENTKADNRGLFIPGGQISAGELRAKFDRIKIV